MHSGKRWIYGGQPVYISKDTCRVWPKTAKIQDGRQRLFEPNIFLTYNPIINCMSFLTNFVGRNPFLEPILQLKADNCYL